MATLTNTQISVTYVGLLKTSANTVLTSTAQQITDGDGNNSIMFLSTAGVGIGGSPTSGKELDVTGNVLVTGDLQVDNINIDANTISATSGVVTLADGAIATTQSQNDNSTKIATTAYVDAAVDSVDTLAEVLAIGNTTGTTKISVNNTSSGIDFIDDALLRLGTGNDLVIRHDASNSHIENATGILNIEANNLRLGNFGTDDYIIATNAGSVELYHNDVKKFETTSTGAKVQSTGTATLTLLDADDSSEVSINHNAGVTTLIYSDLIFDNGGGNNVLQLDSAIKALENISLPDSKQLNIGSSGADLRLTHSGTNSFIQNFTGDLQIQQQADDKDILFRGDDGSGGITTYFRLNGDNSDVIFDSHIELEDNVELRIGSSGADLRMLHNGSNSFIQNFVGDLEIHQEAADKDILFRCDDGSGGITTYFMLDGGNTNMVASKTILYNDSVKASFGNSEDLKIKHDGTNSSIENVTGDLTIQNGADDKDIIFKSDDGSGGTTEYFKLDGSITSLVASKDIVFNDSVRAEFGNAGDFDIYHDGTDSRIENSTGDLLITQFVDNEDIRFFCDDGTGGTSEYLRFDGSEVSTKIFTQKVIMSNLPTSDPNNAGQLYNDSGTLKISAG